MTPRERGGRSGSTSGYCCVVVRLVIVLSVTASPLIRPLPGTLRSPSAVMSLILPGRPIAREHTPGTFSSTVGRDARPASLEAHDDRRTE